MRGREVSDLDAHRLDRAASARLILQFHRLDNAIHDCFGRRPDVHAYGGLIRLWLFQVSELAGEKARRHEVAVAPSQPRRDHLLRAGKVDEYDSRSAAIDQIAVRALERGTRNDAVLAGVETRLDPLGHLLQPRPAIAVVERVSRRHLVDIRPGMERVALLERPAEALCEQLSDRRLPAARNSHENDDHWRLLWSAEDRAGGVGDSVSRRSRHRCGRRQQRRTGFTRIYRIYRIVLRRISQYQSVRWPTATALGTAP